MGRSLCANTTAHHKLMTVNTPARGVVAECHGRMAVLARSPEACRKQASRCMLCLGWASLAGPSTCRLFDRSKPEKEPTLPAASSPREDSGFLYLKTTLRLS